MHKEQKKRRNSVDDKVKGTHAHGMARTVRRRSVMRAMECQARRLDYKAAWEKRWDSARRHLAAPPRLRFERVELIVLLHEALQRPLAGACGDGRAGCR